MTQEEPPMTTDRTSEALPDYVRVSPPFTNRAQVLAQAFREAVSMAHEKGTKLDEWRGLEHKPLHPNVEDADYNCTNGWCQRFWSMVREAEAAASPSESPAVTEALRHRVEDAINGLPGLDSPGGYEGSMVGRDAVIEAVVRALAATASPQAASPGEGER